MSIKRYDFGTEYKGNTGVPAIVSKVNGRYVKHEDYAALATHHAALTDRQRRGEPVAYAFFADNGNIRIWTKQPDAAGNLVPLYIDPHPPEPLKYDGKHDERYVTGWNDCVATLCATGQEPSCDT